MIVGGWRHGVNPFAYLRDVLTRLAALPVSQLPELLPNRWQAARDAANVASA